MPLFEYVVKDLSGEESAGVETASSMDAVVDHLHRRGCIVLSIEEKHSANGSSIGIRERLSNFQIPGLTGVSIRTLALFTRQLGTMLNAGLPLVRGLNSLAKDEKSGY